MWLALTKAGSVLTLVWLKRRFVTRQKAEFTESLLHNGGNIRTLFLLDNCMTQGWMSKNNCQCCTKTPHAASAAMRAVISRCAACLEPAQHSTRLAQPSKRPKSTVTWLHTYTPHPELSYNTSKNLFCSLTAIVRSLTQARVTSWFQTSFSIKPCDFNPP